MITAPVIIKKILEAKDDHLVRRRQAELQRPATDARRSLQGARRRSKLEEDGGVGGAGEAGKDETGFRDHPFRQRAQQLPSQ